jgi:hypothetical protein
MHEFTEVDMIMAEFHSSLCGGHHFWKAKPTKFSELGTIGPPCLLMSIEKLEPVSNVKGLQENNRSGPCH